MRASYWVNSKFAKKLTVLLGGVPKPAAATAKGWVQWRKDAKAQSKFAYWVVEHLLDGIDDFVHKPAKWFDDLNIYVYNRWIAKAHIIHPAGFKPGQYYEAESLIMCGMFQVLCDFVEVQLAHQYVGWSRDKERHKKYGYIDRKWRVFSKQWRSPEAGLAWLEERRVMVSEGEGWDSTPKGQLTRDALSAQVTYDLYKWWTVERPNRVDPAVASGSHALMDRRRGLTTDPMEIFDFEDDDAHPGGKSPLRAAFDYEEVIRKNYRMEDDAMMIRLLEHRQTLWT